MFKQRKGCKIKNPKIAEQNGHNFILCIKDGMQQYIFQCLPSLFTKTYNIPATTATDTQNIEMLSYIKSNVEATECLCINNIFTAPHLSGYIFRFVSTKWLHCSRMERKYNNKFEYTYN